MTAAERRRINRANGAKSRGPLTDATKSISSRNRLTHGLCAKVHALPNEDPHEARDEATRWLEHYQPRTEHHHELVERIASACTLQRRCQRACDATVAAQVLNADADIDLAQEAEVDALTARLRKEPAAAVSGLRRTSLGCRWLIGRWERLRDQLDWQGGLGGADADELIRLHGHRVFATAQRLPDPVAFELRLHTVMSCPGVQPAALEAMLYGVPEGLKPAYRARWGDPEANRAELRRRIDAALAELSQREERLRSGREAVERATAEDRALVIADPEKARLWVRYYNESNSAFYRASRELQRSLEEDEGGAETVGEASSPNEPNDSIGGPLSDDSDASSYASAAVVSECAAERCPEPDRVAARIQPVATTRVSPPASGAADGPSPNEPNGPARPRLSLDQIKGFAAVAAPLAGPCATALAAHLEALQRSDLSDAQRTQVTQAMERELATLKHMIRRLEADETAA